MKNLIGIVAIVTMLSSCVSTTQYAKFAGTDDKIKSAENAKIYVLRPSILANIIKMEVFCDRNFIGETGPKSYLCWEVKEGKHTIRSTSENEEIIKIDAKAGKTYYIKQIPRMGFVIARVSLENLDEKEGQAILKKLKKPRLNYTE